MFCKNCGHLIQKNFRVCPRCSAPAQKENGKPAVGILILFALCFGIIAAVFLGGCQSDKSLAGTEKGTSRTLEEASQIVLSDIPQEDWEIFMDTTGHLSTIVSGYSGENGFVSPQDTEAVMNAVTEEVDRLYREGIVSFYSCQEEAINFEYASGLTAFYAPSQEGNASGGDDVILALDPYETDLTNETMTNKAAVSGSYITDALESCQMDAYENSEVTLDLLRNLPTCSVFLWNGHGYVVTQYQQTYSVLLTGEKADGLAKYSGLSLSADKVLVAVGNVNYWAITPFFVEKYISLDQGLAYLSACFSGANDLMAAAFVNSGAEVVFVNAGSCEVSTFYTQSIMEYVTGYMAGCYDGIFHTAAEALTFAEEKFESYITSDEYVSSGVILRDGKKQYDSLEAYVNGRQGGTHTEIRQEENYTLCPCIRGSVSFHEELSSEERADVLDELTVELRTENHAVLRSVSLTDDSVFYFNDLDPGTYYVNLYRNSALIISQEITVQEHRYVTTDLYYTDLTRLTGYVYDTSGTPLPDVSVTAELTSDPDLYEASAVTDETGCYSIEVYGENTYTLNYECQGYQSASHEFAVTEDMGQSIQADIPVLLDDVFLEQDENVVSAESGQYWVVFREGYRNSRIELSVVSSPVSRDSLCIVWNKSMTLNNTEGMSRSSQYYLTEAGAWEYMREYHRLTDYATEVIASSLDIYDADGNLILAASDYNDLDLASLTE